MVDKTLFRYKGVRLFLVLLLLLFALLSPGCSIFNTAKTPSTPVTTSSQPVSDNGPQFSFIVCGDPQNNYDVFAKIVSAAKSVDFLIIAGDLTGSGTRTELNNFKNFMQDSGVTYYTVPGNHDVASGPVDEVYSAYFGNPYSSFSYENSHFILIDNSTPELGFYPGEREWARSDLEAARSQGFQHIFAVCHVPPRYPYSAKADSSQLAGMDANKQLVPLLSSMHVEQLFCGHLHAYEQTREDNLPITITGGAGAPLMDAWGPDAYYHYILVEVNGKHVDQEIVKI